MRRLLALLFLASSPAFAAFHMVTPTGAGTHSGADWNNAMVGNTILNNTALVRGDVYCLGGGSYNQMVLNTAVSGTLAIELRAATPSDAGCGNTIAGWSATIDTTQNPIVSTIGSLVQNSGSCAIYTQTSYWFFNGVSRTGPKGTYNWKMVNNWPNFVRNFLCGSGFGYQNTNIHVAYLRYSGGGIHEDTTESVSISSISRTSNVTSVTITPNCAAGQRCIMPWFTNQYVTISGVTDTTFNCTACQITSVTGNVLTYTNTGANGSSTGGTVAGVEGTENAVYLVGSSTAHTTNDEIDHCYFTDSNSGPIQIQYIDSSNIHDNVFGADSGTPADHANHISGDALTSVGIYRNVFEDCESTACISSGVNHLTDNGVFVYDNIVYTHSGNPFHQSGVGNGFYSTTTTTGQTNVHLYNNSIGAISGSITQQNGILFNTGATATTCSIQNNLVWGNGTAITGSTASGCTEDHNTALYVATNTLFTAASDVVSTTNTAGNPFTNWTGTCSSPGGVVPTCSGENYNLVSAGTGNWDGRLSLGAPYDTDFANVAFTSSRGAYQFASATPQVGLSPTSIAFGNIVQNTTSGNQTITLCNGSWSGSTCNAAGATLNITSIALTGTNAAQFAIATNNCGASLAAGSTCTVLVNFTPNAVASFSANLTFTTNAASSPDNAPLSGSGVAAPANNGIATPGIPFGMALNLAPNITKGFQCTLPCTVTFSCPGCAAGSKAIGLVAV